MPLNAWVSGLTIGGVDSLGLGRGVRLESTSLSREDQGAEKENEDQRSGEIAE